MVSYCPYFSQFFKAAAWRYAVIFILFFLFFPLSARGQSGGLFDACGPGFPICGAGLSCVKGECLGANGYITNDPNGCSPELTWKDNRCIVDIETHGEQLGLGGTAKDIRDNIRTAINIALGFVGVLGVIMIIYSGFLWMFAAGNEERISKAKRTMIWTAVGLVVIGSAWTIASYFLSIGSRLGGAGNGTSGTSGGSGGVPSTGGVVEQFAISDQETARGNPEKKSEDIYLCSSIQTRFNHYIKSDSFETTKADFKIKEDPGNGKAIDDWADVTKDKGAWVMNGNYATYEHTPAKLFTPNKTYAAIYPRALTDTDGFPLANCAGLEGCDIKDNSIIWQFKTGETVTEAPPSINPSGTYPLYPRAFNDEGSVNDPSYPSRGVPQAPIIIINFTEPALASSLVKEVDVEIEKEKVKRQIPNPDTIAINMLTAENPSAEDIKSNKLFSGSEVKPLDNTQFIAVIESNGYGTRLVIQLADTSKNFSPNRWYQIDVKGVLNLCGNPMQGNPYWHFQASGDTPSLNPTPPNGLKNVCYQDIAIGVVSNVSMYDILTGKCAVDPLNGGFITGGKITPLLPANRVFAVLDDVPAQKPENFNYNNYCHQYFFTPQSEPLSKNTEYTVDISSRYTLPDGMPLAASWKFKTSESLDNCIRPPYITSIDPIEGPKGQCLSIIGQNLDYFKDGARNNLDAVKVESIEMRKLDEKGKSIATPAVGLNGYIDENIAIRWSNASVLTKVQDAKGNLPPEFTIGATYRIAEHIVDASNNLDQLFESPQGYVLTAAAIGPCLESVAPASAFRQDLLTLKGSGFGADSGGAAVVYEGEVRDTGFDENVGELWGDTLIASRIPFEAQPKGTGNVYIATNQGLVSNSKPLTLPTLVLVKAFSREACAPYISPNPTVKQEDVCVLGQADSLYVPVYLEFYSDDTKVTDITGGNSEFAKPAYYRVFTCPAFDDDSGCVEGSLQNFALRRIIPDPKNSQIVHSAVEFQIKNPEFDKIYKIKIDPIIDDSGIATPADFKGYEWQFKTMATANELCKEVKSVTVTLDKPEVQVFNSSEAQATADNFQCQSFASAEFSWSVDQPYLKAKDQSWAKVENGALIAQLTIPSSSLPRIPIQSLDSSYSEAKAHIKATVIKVDDVAVPQDPPKTNNPPAELTVRNSAYCESPADCAKNCPGAPDDAIACEDHQCNPYIKSLSPDKGKVNDWITVFGCYFGATAGAVNFKQGEVTTPALTGPFPDECKQTVWSDTQIITIVPGGLQITDTGDPKKPHAYILVTPLQKKESVANDFSKFTVDENTINRPQICAVQNQTEGDCKEKPCGSPNDKVEVIGKGLAGATSVKFTKLSTTNTSSVSEEPSDKSVKSIVPIEAENGAHTVSILSAEPESNPLQFQVNDEGGAHLINFWPPRNEFEPCSVDPKQDFCKYDGTQYAVSALLEFDHGVVCDNIAECIQLYKCELANCVARTQIGVFYTPDSPGITDTEEPVKKIGLLPDKKDWLLGNRYKIVFNKEKLTTRSSHKKIDCGSLEGTDNECTWSFTLDKQVIPGTITVTPDIAVIIVNPDDPAATNPPPTYTAIVKDVDKNDITNVVSIEWSVSDLQAISVAPKLSSNAVVTANDLGNKVYKPGKYQVTAKVTGSNVSGSANVKIQNDATLHISGYSPQGNNACTNSAVSISFDKPLDPKTYQDSVSIMVAGTDLNSHLCFSETKLATEQNSRGIFGKFLKQLARLFGIFLGQAADYTKCDDVKIELISPTTIAISSSAPGFALIPGTEYKVKVLGQLINENVNRIGITASDGMPLWATSQVGCAIGDIKGDIIADDTERSCSYTFTTRAAQGNDKGLCSLTHIAVIGADGKSPPDNNIFFYQKKDKTVYAQGYAGKNDDYTSKIDPVTAVYDWTFQNWRIEPDSGILSLTPSWDKSGVSPVLDKNKNLIAGDANIAVSLDTINAHGNTGVNANPASVPVAPAHISIKPCDVDGNNGAQLFWEFKDTTEPQVNFSFWYCQKPTESSQTLPRLSNAPVALSSASSRGVLKEYFLIFNQKKCDETKPAPDCDPNYDATASKDKFLVRVFPANDYFVPKNGVDPLDLWYQAVEQNPDLFPNAQSAQKINPIADYSARKTETSVYVHALNVDDSLPAIYSNVYVIAVTEGASDKTIAVLNQLVKNWRFNTNVEESKIAALKHDYRRVQDLTVLGGQLVDYRNFYGKYPELLDSKVKGVAISVWDNEWRTNTNGPKTSLAAALSVSAVLPLDPLDPGASQQVVSDSIQTTCLGSSLSDGLYQCLWGQDGTHGKSINRCLAKEDYVNVDEKKVLTIADLQTLGLGYDANNAIDARELYTCYNDEAKIYNGSDLKTTGDYYCRGAGSAVYQYSQENNAQLFTLYGNLEYTISNEMCGTKDETVCNSDKLCKWDAGAKLCRTKSIWCNAWKDELHCVDWSGGTASMCEWYDPDTATTGGELCLPRAVAQPICASALPNADGSRNASPESKTNAFNFMFKPL